MLLALLIYAHYDVMPAEPLDCGKASLLNLKFATTHLGTWS